jgi:hypothetical protein
VIEYTVPGFLHWWAVLLPFILFLWTGIALAAQDTWNGVERVVALGDVHGDYQQFVTLLRAAGVIDQHDAWTGGKTHLVQVGDVPDRGPESRRAMDLLMALEKQASKAGGYVHALIGNHEAMNLYGDLRYTTREEFAAFAKDDPRNAADLLYLRHIEEQKKANPSGKLPKFDKAYRQQWESQVPAGFFAHRYQFGPSGTYGKWIRGHNAIVKINDTLYLHGGLSPKYAKASMGEINEAVRAELEDFSKLAGGMVMDEEGPLWYRGLALDDEKSLETHVTALLAHHGAARIVVGHTVTEGAVIPRFEGRVLLIDAGMTQFYGARQACLVIEDGKPYALHRGNRFELPANSGADFLRYLKQAAALDPPPSPLDAGIKDLEAKLAVASPGR